MKLTYKQKLFFSFAVIFMIFATGILLFEQKREKNFKTHSLEEKLDVYSEVINNTLSNDSIIDAIALTGFIKLLPPNLRLTVISKSGEVLFDNSVNNSANMENHLHRPEIMIAGKKGKGNDIRLSASTHKEYIYYARDFGNRFIRVALPYNVQTKRLLQPDKLFVLFIILFFVVMILLINAITNRFSKSVSQLRDFINSADKEKLQEYDFPHDELGFIGAKITENYNNLKISEKQIGIQKEKLLNHVQISEEGLCFFDSQRNVEFYNGLFVKYLNTIISEKEMNPNLNFADREFSQVVDFLENSKEKYYETQINKQGKIFSIRLNRFDDNSFELILNDITQQEKLHTLKQEMTGNVSHELRTPITSISAYLETLQNNDLEEKTRQYFIAQAYNQTRVLSELINDMSLLSKIDASPSSFNLERINIKELITHISNDFQTAFEKKNINFKCSVSNTVNINGNRNLLSSIFRNLIDNAVHYAGENVGININVYNEDSDFYYFSFYDTGVGIKDETHLNRLFERFYRIDEGRSRNMGGSGLGLSIVKNAVLFHKGSIVVKNRTEGGLKFIFNLHK